MSLQQTATGFTLATALALCTGHAIAGTAIWTGNTRFVTTVTYQQGIACEYNYLGQKFWRTFVGIGSCPSSIEVQ